LHYADTIGWARIKALSLKRKLIHSRNKDFLTFVTSDLNSDEQGKTGI